MSTNAISIATTAPGTVNVTVTGKPRAEEVQASLVSLGGEEVRAIAVALPGALASEFMLVQALAFLRREGKQVSLSWTDHPPSPALQQMIESLIP